MGMTIDDSRESAPMSREEVAETLKTMVFGVQAFERFNAKERETLDKAWNIIDQYENRLKADMVAMLTDMLIDVEEIESREQWCDYANDNCISRYDVEDLIQKKINSLKEAQNDREKDI